MVRQTCALDLDTEVSRPVLQPLNRGVSAAWTGLL